MDTKESIQKRVKEYYWHDDINCATTSLKILSEKFGVELSNQIIDAALGMHGAGKYGAQCGLVEGTLMFLGILGRRLNISDDNIVNSCNEFAGQFENRFKTLLCNMLRPEGFHSNNPQHLCEGLTCEAIYFSIEFMGNFINKHNSLIKCL